MKNIEAKIKRALYPGLKISDSNFNFVSNRNDPRCTSRIRKYIENLLEKSGVDIEKYGYVFHITNEDCDDGAVSIAAIRYLDVINDNFDINGIHNKIKNQVRITFGIDIQTGDTLIREVEVGYLDFHRFSVEVNHLYNEGRKILMARAHLNIKNITTVFNTERLIIDMWQGVVRIRVKKKKFFELFSLPQTEAVLSRYFVLE